MDSSNEDANTKTKNHNKTAKKLVNGTLKRKLLSSKLSKRKGKASKSNPQNKLQTKLVSSTTTTASTNSKPKKKKKKRRKTKHEPAEPLNFNVTDIKRLAKDIQNNKENTTMNGLLKTNTSPILIPQLSLNDIDLHTIDDHKIPDLNLSPVMAAKSPFEAIKQHKMKKNKARKSPRKVKKFKPSSIKTPDLSSTETNSNYSSTQEEYKHDDELIDITPITNQIKNNLNKKLKHKKRKKHFVSGLLEQQHLRANHGYFQNYFDRNSGKPTQINTLLDRMERDLQFIFSDNFLNNSFTLRTKKIYSLIVSLHQAFMEYKLSLLLPVCKMKLLQLDAMFLSLIKWFNRFKRYHRSPQIHKHKQQINKLKINVDILINNIESNCSVILYALIRTKQLYIEFHKNSKLLIFWIELFPEDELEFIQLSWINFVNSIRVNKSFKKFKMFNAEEMTNVLTENYEILSISEFLKYVLEYDSVGGWLDDMYAYISEEIKNPHKKCKSRTQSLTDLDSITQSNVEQRVRPANNEQVLFDRQDSVIIHDVDSDNSMDGVEEHTAANYENGGHCESMGRSSSTSSEMVVQRERDEWKKVIKSLEDEISQLKSDNYEYSEKIRGYELRMNGARTQTKQFFNLERKLDYHERLAALLKHRCLSLHQQMDQDLIQFTQWTDNNNNNSNIELETQISEIRTSLSNIKKHVAEKTKIKTICNDILEENNQHCNSTSDIALERVCKSFELALSEIYCIQQQLQDINGDGSDGNYKSAVPKRVHFGKCHSALLTPPIPHIFNKFNVAAAASPTEPQPREFDNSTLRLSFSTESFASDTTQSTLNTPMSAHSAAASPESDIPREIPIFTRTHSASFYKLKNNLRHQRQQTYSVATLKEKMVDDNSEKLAQNLNMLPRTYSDRDLNGLKHSLSKPAHFRNHTSSVAHTAPLTDRKHKANNVRWAHNSKHKRYETSVINARLLSPSWAANVAMHNIHSSGSFDDGMSDVISTLSNVDYTYMLDAYYDQELKDEAEYEYPQYVNVNPYAAMNRRHQSTFSVVDALNILDEEMLTDLKRRNENDFKLEGYEIEMKDKLVSMLREMDLMAEGRLDIADFTSGVMNAVKHYDDIMEDAELLFETMQDLQDDMGAIKIMDIVDAIMLNNDDGAAMNIKQQIIIGLNLNVAIGENERVEDEDGDVNNNNDTIEDMTELNVKEIEIDPNQQPYKPMYALSNGIQKI